MASHAPPPMEQMGTFIYTNLILMCILMSFHCALNAIVKNSCYVTKHVNIWIYASKHFRKVCTHELCNYAHLSCCNDTCKYTIVYRFVVTINAQPILRDRVQFGCGAVYYASHLKREINNQCSVHERHGSFNDKHTLVRRCLSSRACIFRKQLHCN